LGFGFRCGFLGLLHMEIIQERLEREYDLDLIITAPSVIYKVKTKTEELYEIENPADFPEHNEIEVIKEPFVEATVHVPEEHIGPIMELCQENRGEFIDMQYVDENRMALKYKMPLSEIITGFFNQLKSKSKGYATLDYEMIDYEEADLVKLDILVNKEPVDALSTIVFSDDARYEGQKIVRKLKEIMPKQMFKVPIQAAVGSDILARVNIQAKRKDVLQKCYGGDISRKRKLLEKQKEGKKRMKMVGKVEIPQEAFMSILERNEDD
ncbi:MAG: elongation factor 4, partial [Halanaerobiales bacterium]